MSVGDVLFVLGANGTGKSGLMQYLYSHYEAQWISAHRQNWMQSHQLDISPHSKFNQEQQVRQQDLSPRARWLDRYSHLRPQLSLMNLVQKKTERMMEITRLTDIDDQKAASTFAKREKDPVAIINEIFDHANLPISISITKDSAVQATQRGNTYGASELSDGERNLLLLAADVLAAPEGSMLLIDEPERHLHRSIISPVLSELFSRRSDCTFIIATHEIMLPIDNPSSRILLARKCMYHQEKTEWDVDLVNSASEIDDGVKRDILGSLRTVIFVEGTEESLDHALYSLIFPSVSIIPKGTRKDVENSVRAIRGAQESQELLRTDAYGIVDDDGHPSNTDGVYSLDVCSIESIYFDTYFQKLVAEKISKETVQDRLDSARRSAMEIFEREAPVLAKMNTVRRMREKILTHLPTFSSLPGDELRIVIDSGSMITEDNTIIADYIERDDYDGIIRNYPIHKTSALDHISKKIGLDGRKFYKDAVLDVLKYNGDARAYVESLLGGLPSRIREEAR